MYMKWALFFCWAPNESQKRPAKERILHVESFAECFSEGGRKIFQLASGLTKTSMRHYIVLFVTMSVVALRHWLTDNVQNLTLLMVLWHWQCRSQNPVSNCPLFFCWTTNYVELYMCNGLFSWAESLTKVEMPSWVRQPGCKVLRWTLFLGWARNMRG